jgi:hypothetical protein
MHSEWNINEKNFDGRKCATSAKKIASFTGPHRRTETSFFVPSSRGYSAMTA